MDLHSAARRIAAEDGSASRRRLAVRAAASPAEETAGPVDFSSVDIKDKLIRIAARTAAIRTGALRDRL